MNSDKKPFPIQFKFCLLKNSLVYKGQNMEDVNLFSLNILTLDDFLIILRYLAFRHEEPTYLILIHLSLDD